MKYFAKIQIALLLGLTLFSQGVQAETIAARETAYVDPAGTWTTGIFNPLRIGVDDKTSVETHPLMDIIGGFNFAVQSQLMQNDAWVLSYKAGLTIPTMAYRLSQQIPLASPFFPTWAKSPRHIGWTLEPSLGLLWSHGQGDAAIWTVRADLTIGMPLELSDAYPVDSMFAPLELLLAPTLTGFRARAGVGYDYPVLDWLRLRAQGNIYLTGNHPADQAQLSPLFIEGYAGIDIGLGANARMTLGAKWYNWDQHATEVQIDDQNRAQRRAVRSNDFYPTVDFIWHS